MRQQLHTEHSIFRQSSTTYFNAARFFPKATRADVLKLYSFIRVTEAYANGKPSNAVAFNNVRRGWRYYRSLPLPQLSHREGDDLNTRVVKNICSLAASYHFDHEWIEAFFDSMQMDIERVQYETLEDTLAYVYGSAEVIGLMVAKILGVTVQAHPAAMMQGRAMCYIKFIRDIDEDARSGRCYFPVAELRRFGLPALTKEAAQHDPAAFKLCMRAQLAYYHEWQHEADGGLHYLPRRGRVALRTAVDGYNWVAEQIGRQPFIVFEKRLRPSRRRLLASGMGHMFD